MERFAPIKQNSIQTGAFGRNEMLVVAGTLLSLKMTGQFITQSNDRIYVITAPNSDAQFKGFTDCLNCKDWWCEIKYTM